MGEKTEKATPKKLRDAKKKGQVAKSQDLPSAFTFIVSIGVLLAMGGYLFNNMRDFTIASFRLIPNQELDNILAQLYLDSALVIFTCSIPVLAIVAVVGVLINFLTVGPVFAVEVFKFDPKKFDPVQNLKAKFKMKTLVELLKSCIKIGIASYLIYRVMMNSLPVLIRTLSIPTAGALLVFNAFLMEVVIKVGLFFIFIAIADFAYQKFDFAKEMKMEKFEVKQEYKNTEGDPHIKGKRRQIAQEIAYSEGPAGGVKRAQAVVTNPQHIAVALGYNKEVDAAPYIIAMGQDLIAQRIIKMAEIYGVPVIRNIKLARKLWEDGDVHEYVPEDTYDAVAEIIRWINALNTEGAFEYSEK